MEERRSSRIPRPAAPSGTRPLAERTMNTAAAANDKKRRAVAPLDAIPEPNNKRHASSQNNGFSARPTRSAPAPPSGPTSSSAPAQSFQSEGNQKGPGAGEETFEDIHARTGASEEDILSKKMAFRKGLKPEKKIEEMAPMIKELRAVGWHLLSGRSKAVMDAEQWKTHSEQLEVAAATDKLEWAKKQDAIEAQMKDIQEMLGIAEANTLKLTSELKAAEDLVAERSAALAATSQQLANTSSELEATKATLKEKEAKVREMEDVVRQSQAYSSTLQSYNTSLQNDLKEEKTKRDEAAKERDVLQSKAAELTGQVKSLEHQLSYDKEQVVKLSGEREVLLRDVAALRTDLDTTRQERDRLLAENTKVTQELERIRSVGGNSLETIERLSNQNATLEVQLSTQQRLLGDMRQELAMAKEQRALAESTTTSHGNQVTSLASQVAELTKALSDAEAKILHSEGVRRKLHNIIQELKGNIRVFCRVRPISSAERSANEHDSTMALEFPQTTDVLGAGIVLNAPARGSGVEGPAAPSRHSFTFDKVFAPTSSQELVFEEISELVQSALDGDKVCIFAYGQTGSGKTYTMLGTDENPGMIPRAMRQIFDTSCKLGSQGWSFAMQASMLEIYNEEYKDLLCKRKAPGDKKHNIQHNADGSTTVTDMTCVDVSSTEKVEALLVQAMERRSVGSTQLNEHSSRSHMVFMLKIDGTNSVTGQTIAGVLSLVDLAGSERVKESGATGQQMKEAQNINKSLSALGDVIAAIGNKEKHIPFRNSKLTFLLQNCLGGDAKTLMFVNIAPTREFAGESLCSLRFAAKVNACEINPRKQVTK